MKSLKYHLELVIIEFARFVDIVRMSEKAKFIKEVSFHVLYLLKYLRSCVKCLLCD